MSDDPFEDVFTIEDRFYTTGYNEGMKDGIIAGRTEGRSLGMQKGYEKFTESARLAARAVVWANRIPASEPPEARDPTAAAAAAAAPCSLPPLATANVRLEKNIASLYALVEPGTLSTRNDDEAIQDFDDRVKRAQGKMKVVERMVGEKTPALGKAEAPPHPEVS